MEIQKFEYLENEKSCFDEIKIIFHGHVHIYEAVFGRFVDTGIVVTFLSFA